jgi:hypothetical protein
MKNFLENLQDLTSVFPYDIIVLAGAGFPQSGITPGGREARRHPLHTMKGGDFMIRIEQNRAYNLQDYSAVLDLQVSTTAELPAKDSEVTIWKVLPGSIAQVIQSGIFCTLDYNGKWYDSDGSEVVIPEPKPEVSGDER